MKSFTKDGLKAELIAIREQGFLPNEWHGNHGGIGNTLERLLGIDENNLPIPNASEWELKAQKIGTKSLTTLFHMEPSPQAMSLVVNQLLPYYGWAHQGAGTRYSSEEKSFRQTIHGLSRSDRGFKVVIDEDQEKVMISFDAGAVAVKHAAWLKKIETTVGLGELEPQPYWGFNDLFHKAGTKLLNCFYVQAAEKKLGDKLFYHYTNIQVLSGFSIEKFLEGIKVGAVLVDFDARSGHNHGTKFRLRQNYFQNLYEHSESI